MRKEKERRNGLRKTVRGNTILGSDRSTGVDLSGCPGCQSPKSTPPSKVLMEKKTEQKNVAPKPKLLRNPGRGFLKGGKKREIAHLRSG